MVWRKLGDGSVLNTETGELAGYNPQAEAAGRRTSAQMGHLPEQRRAAAQRPVMNKAAPNNPGVVVPTPSGGEKVIIRPPQKLLALNPYELGMNGGVGSLLPTMSDGTKRIVATGAIVALALGAVWINNKFKSKPAPQKHQKK